MAARLGFAGDVMLGRLVDEHQRSRAVDAVWGDVLANLRALDGLFVNLECCLSTRGSPWTETHRPFHFRADPGWAVPALSRAGVDWTCLANNHVLDYGREALADTLAALDDAGISHAGAGERLEAAFAPATVDVGDRTVALVAVTDNTPEYAASRTASGTAYAEIDRDDAETRRRVESALGAARATDPDLLVASLHWGPNMVAEPPAAFRRFARWLIERGVDLVHGHSAHVFQGVEVYEGVPILYDTGDFVDDYAVDDDLRNDRSFLFEASVTSAGVDELRLRPTEIRDFAVHQAGPDAAVWSRERMRSLSEPFGTEFEQAGDGLRLVL